MFFWWSGKFENGGGPCASEALSCNLGTIRVLKKFIIARSVILSFSISILSYCLLLWSIEFAVAINATVSFMWRSNALCLRSCSSIPIHNGLKKRWYSGAKALPVSEDEFMQALDNVHSLLKRNNNRRRQRTLGKEFIWN